MAIMDSDWWHKPWPTGVLLFGVLMLLLAVIGTFTGKAYGKGCSVERAKEPVSYWTLLAIEYFSGILFVWLGAYGMPR